MSRSLRAITPVTIISRGLLVGGLLYSPLLLAQEGGITLFNTVQTATGQDYNVKIEILILMTLLGLLPIMMLMMTFLSNRMKLRFRRLWAAQKRR